MTTPSTTAASAAAGHRPTAGQVWVAHCVDATVTGVLLAVDIDDDIAEFAPVAGSRRDADPYTAIATADVIALPAGAAIFAGLTTPIPLFTLELLAGAIPSHLLSSLQTLWRANRVGAPPPSTLSITTGTPDVDEHDPRRSYRIALRRTTSQLQAATHLPATRPPGRPAVWHRSR